MFYSADAIIPDHTLQIIHAVDKECKVVFLRNLQQDHHYHSIPSLSIEMMPIFPNQQLGSSNTGERGNYMLIRILVTCLLVPIEAELRLAPRTDLICFRD